MSKSKNNVLFWIIIIVVIIGISVGMYFLLKPKSNESFAPPISKDNCHQPSICGFEKKHSGNDWCYTEANNSGKWDKCNIDKDSSPWKECKAYLEKPDSTNISDSCLNALWKDTGCGGTYIDGNASKKFKDWAKARTLREIVTDNNQWYAKGCGEKGLLITKVLPVNEIETELNTNINLVKNEIETFSKDEDEIDKPVNTIKCINSILEIKEKVNDKVKANLDLVDGVSTTLKDYKNFNLYITEIVKNYTEGISRLTGEYVNNQGKTYDEATKLAKEQAIKGLKIVYKTFKCKGTVNSVLGENNIKDFEDEIKKQTGVDVSVNCVEGYGGVEYDANGNVIEYQCCRGGSCYLITALTRNNLLSIEQVYQLNKMIFEVFNNKSNHTIISFYFSNFREIADFLERTGQLSKIKPGVLKCVELIRQGQFQFAFDRYVIAGHKAFQICKDSGMDVSEIERNWDNLEEVEISRLPEPDTLFGVSFKELIKSF
jgi:hypothetical protein